MAIVCNLLIATPVGPGQPIFKGIVARQVPQHDRKFLDNGSTAFAFGPAIFRRADNLWFGIVSGHGAPPRFR